MLCDLILVHVFDKVDQVFTHRQLNTARGKLVCAHFGGHSLHESKVHHLLLDTSCLLLKLAGLHLHEEFIVSFLILTLIAKLESLVSIDIVCLPSCTYTIVPDNIVI